MPVSSMTRAAGAILVVLALAALTACDGNSQSPASGKAKYQPPFVPVEFSVDTKGRISVSAGKSLTTFIGRFSVEGELGADLVTHDSVFVLITHRVAGQVQRDGYRIAGMTSLVTCLDGRFFQKMSANKVEISALSGVSTIRVLRGDAQEGQCAQPTPGGGDGGQVATGPPIPCPPQISVRLPDGEGHSAALRSYYRTTRFYLYICRSTRGTLWYQGATQFRPDHWLVAPARQLPFGYRMALGNTTIVIDDKARALRIQVGDTNSGDSILEFAHYAG